MIEYLFDKIEETINYSDMEQETHISSQVMEFACIAVYRTGLFRDKRK